MKGTKRSKGTKKNAELFVVFDLFVSFVLPERRSQPRTRFRFELQRITRGIRGQRCSIGGDGQVATREPIVNVPKLQLRDGLGTDRCARSGIDH